MRIHEGAAAEGQDHRVAGQQAADDAAFAVAEGWFAVAGKEFGNGAAGGELDFLVGIAERQAEPGGEATADGGFASAHQADQHDAAAGDRIGDRNRLPQGSVACHNSGR